MILTKEGTKLAQEHANCVAAIRAIVETTSGREFFKYCFKEFGVGTLPEPGINGEYLHGLLGHLRAGTAIFSLVAEAHAEFAGRLLADVQKERYNELVNEDLERTDENDGTGTD